MKLQFLILVIINFLCFYLAFNLFLLSFLSIFSLPNLPDALQLYRFSKRFHAKINHVKLFVNKQTILYDQDLRFISNRGPWAGIAQSVQRLATGWTVRGSNRGGGRDFPYPSIPALQPTQPPIQWVTDLFRGGKAAGRGVNHPPTSNAEVKERVELYIYSVSGPSWPVLERTLLFTFTLLQTGVHINSFRICCHGLAFLYSQCKL